MAQFLTMDGQRFDGAELIEKIASQYEYHLKIAKKLKAMLDAAELVDKQVITYPSAMNGNSNLEINAKELPKDKISSPEKKTFERWIQEILSDGKPRTVRMLMNKYYELTSIEIDRNGFSSRLSGIFTNKNSIRSVEFKEYPNEIRYWWCLAEWFDGHKLKQAYIEKINLDALSQLNEMEK